MGDQPFIVSTPGQLGRTATRRTFLKVFGAGGTVILLPSVMAACDDDDEDMVGPPDPPDGATLDFSTDLGVLNYAYALEQLEAAFYTQVLDSLYSGASDDEEQVLMDLRDHEIVHRDFLEAALGDDAIGALTVNFDDVDFASRDSVLTTAVTFEDLGVSAYNGAGTFLSDADFLTVAGKIVSVEARHASVVRSLLELDFAPDAFDAATEPADVLAAAEAYIENEITLQNA